MCSAVDKEREEEMGDKSHRAMLSGGGGMKFVCMQYQCT